MAKITIELDTAAGDTLEQAFKAFYPMVLIAGETEPEAQADIYAKVAAKIYKDPTPAQFGTRDEIVTAGKAMVEDPVQPTVRVYTQPAHDEDVAARNHIGLLTEYDGDRKRGTAGPNGGRRTKAQIAEDALYFDQVKERGHAALAEMEKGVHDHENPGGKYVITGQSGVEAVDAGGLISSGEERVNPEDAAQDAQDEAAETATRPTGEPTHEDLRAAYVRYSDKFGAAAAIKDIRGILGCGVNAVPTDKIAEGLAKINAAIDGEPAAATVEPEPVAPTATKEDLIAAMKAYGKAYDGSTDTEAMMFTKEDLPKVFVRTFGEKVTGLGSIPEHTPEAYGKIVSAIEKATVMNTFNRKRVG